MALGQAWPELFSKVKYYNYWCCAIELNGLPAVEGSSIGSILENLEKAKQGALMAYYKRWEDTNIYTFYVIRDFNDDQETVERELFADIEKLGGKIVKKYYSVK